MPMFWCFKEIWMGFIGNSEAELMGLVLPVTQDTEEVLIKKRFNVPHPMLNSVNLVHCASQMGIRDFEHCAVSFSFMTF